MHSLKIFLLDLKVYWKSLVLILVPLLLLPLPIIHSDLPEARCAYVVIIMAIYWMTEVVPLAVTAFLPIFMFPLLNVLSVNDTCANYLKGTNFLFFGGLMVAVAVEDSKLHKRIALKVLLKMGSKPEWLMCGFMLVTAFLSMWISNTATTAMMVPIATAVIRELQKEEEYSRTRTRRVAPYTAPITISAVNQSVDTEMSNVNESHKRVVNGIAATEPVHTTVDIVTEDEERPLKPDGIAKGLMLCICYAANIGGSGTLTGTGPNLVLKGQLDVTFPGEDTGVNYASWMAVAIPPICCKLVICWTVLQLLFFPQQSIFCRLCCKPKKSTADDMHSNIHAILLQKYRQMGSLTFAEGSVLFWFLVLVLLWIFRAPGFMPGWVDLLGIDRKMISDSSSAMLVACILFAWPRNMPEFFCFPNRDSSVPAVSSEALLTWKSMAAKLPWSVIMLLGGSFAMAHGIKESKLADWIGCGLKSSLQGVDTFAMSAIFTILITFITEISSNTATASVFIPIMISLGVSLRQNPLKFAMPATLTSSYAFMLPVATPPNAIVYETGVVAIKDMMFSGMFLNWLCIGVTLTNMRTWSKVIFPMDHFPDWAGGASGANSSYCT